METRSNHVLVGGVVLALILALAGFLVWLSGVNAGHTKAYDIFFKQSVEGLSKGGSVSFAGVPSGQIVAIELAKDNPELVRVRVEVKEETPVLEGTSASIQGSFTGPSTILLDGAIKGAPPLMAMGPNGVPIIPAKRVGLGALLNSAPQLLERISTLTERLTDVLSDKNQKSISGILANFDQITRALATTSPQLKDTLADARLALRQAGVAAEKIGNLADSTNVTLNTQGQPMMADLRETIHSAKKSMDTLDAVLSEARPGVQTFTGKTLPEIGQLVRDLQAMAQTLAAVAEKIDRGGASGLIGAPRLPDYKGGR